MEFFKNLFQGNGEQNQENLVLQTAQEQPQENQVQQTEPAQNGEGGAVLDETIRLQDEQTEQTGPVEPQQEQGYQVELAQAGEGQPGQEGQTAGGDLEYQDEEVTFGTKIKVVAALMIVGFATYIAYWIQQPVEIRTDVLGTPASSQSSSSTQAAQTQQVSILNYAFDPATLNIAPGTTVVWTNNDSVPHNVTSDSFSSATLSQGDTYAYTFNTAGSYIYQSTFDPSMKGYVTVNAGGASQSTASKEQVLSGFGAGAALGLPEPSASATTPESMTPPAAPAESETSAAPDTQASTETPATTPETTSAPESESTPAAVESPAATTAESPLFTPATAENNYQTSTPAPDANLHSAPVQPLNASLNNLGSTAEAEALAAQKAQQNAANFAANSKSGSKSKGKLASSGPEDYVYGGMFALTLFLNRRKLGKSKKSKRK
jgi:plastocyanin